MSLFRMLLVDNGCITIDGTDISHLSSDQLRSSITMIPQEPTLFTGTLRLNLDPTNNQSDSDILAVLQKVYRKTDFLEVWPEGLSTEIVDAGKNLSTGEKHLLCLARALLRRTKIVVLDEATSSVDAKTDEDIQVCSKNFRT